DPADGRVAQPLLDVVADLQIGVEVVPELLGVRVPHGAPALGDAEADSGGMYFVTHASLSYLSATITVMWLVRLEIRLARPLARGRMRLNTGPSSTKICETFSSSMSAPSLCSALAMAESSTFLTL